MTIGERIRYLREKQGLTQEDLAKKLGYKSRSTINKIELGINELTQSKIMAFAKVLNCSPIFLIGLSDEIQECNLKNNENELKELYKNYPSIYPIQKQKIPLLGEISCGKPIYASEDRESYIEIGTDIKADFCLRAYGDSMINARIHDGDIVFIRQQSMVDNGEIAAVIIENEVTLKRVYYYPNENKLILNPENPKFEPLVYINDELNYIKILGKAIAFQSDL